MSGLVLIDRELWAETRSGARAGRGFRYQDAVGAWLAVAAWRGGAAWQAVIPEGVEDITLHGPGREVRSQLKARHAPQGRFSLAEAAQHIAKTARGFPDGWREDPALRIALVLERPVEGLAPSGWTQTLAETGQPLDAFRSAVAVALGPARAKDAAALLDRTHLVVEAEPLERSLELLQETDLPPAALRLVMQRLREVAGQLADANYLAKSDAPGMLGATDVEAELARVRSLLDPAGELALTGGLCEVADFRPLAAEDFYSGVDVRPGHVGAGLVFERPQAMADVLQALESGRRALIAGPSGAGKSALAWLAAYHTRHAVRWHRVRDLQRGDVGRLVELARRLDASPTRPVGFVVDDVGRDETSGWDRLVLELEGLPGVLALGTVREEDVFALSTANRYAVVRPQLDAPLAKRIWKALSAQGDVAFAHWLEPFELSRGLLLEFTHLLTQGRRLAETLDEQVRRRLAEERDDELTVLEVVSFAAAQGASIDAGLLRAHLGWLQPRLARALARLVQEHAIREGADGALGGLHEIRSRHLDAAVRELLATPVEETARTAAQTLRAADFARFIVRTLRDHPGVEAALVAALADRVGASPPADWSAIFHGLGLATMDRVAALWLEASRAAEIDDRFSSTMLGLALAGSRFEEGELFAGYRRALQHFEGVEIADLRAALVEALPQSLPGGEIDLEDHHRLSASLLPIAFAGPPPELVLHPQGELSDAPLVPLLEAIRTSREIGLDAAQELVAAAGGTDRLLERIWHETPWTTRPERGVDDRVPWVSADVRVVHPELQADVHGEVVRLCELLSAADPAAELLISNAIAADGQPAGFGEFRIATKRMPRSALTPPARVAWNRAQLRAAHRLAGGGTETGRTAAIAGAVKELAEKVREAGDFHCRDERPGARWRAFLQVRRLLTSFTPTPSLDEVTDNPLAAGAWSGSDEMHGFVTGLERLAQELTEKGAAEPRLMAARTSDLARQAEGLADPDLWRWMQDPPLKALESLRQSLWNIRAVLGDAAVDPERRRLAALRLATSSRRHPTLQRAADAARERARADAEAMAAEIRTAFAAQGLEAEVFWRPQDKDEGFTWPCVEHLALVAADALLPWLQHEAVLVAVAQALPRVPRLHVAPLIAGQVPPVGMTWLNQLFPYAELVRDWSGRVPYPFAEDRSLDDFTQAFDALTTLSTLIAQRGRPFNAVEADAVQLFYDRVLRHAQPLIDAARTGADPVLAEACGFIGRVLGRVEAEEAEDFVGLTLAAEVNGLTQGQPTELTTELMLHRIALMERRLSEG